MINISTFSVMQQLAVTVLIKEAVNHLFISDFIGSHHAARSHKEILKLIAEGCKC